MAGSVVCHRTRTSYHYVEFWFEDFAFPCCVCCWGPTQGFEFYVFVVGWRYAFLSEWPFITIIIKNNCTVVYTNTAMCGVHR